ncbi:hypothetical protein D3C86_2067980 [compost metagenome]
MADGARRQAQLVCCAGKAQMARRGMEGMQVGELATVEPGARPRGKIEHGVILAMRGGEETLVCCDGFERPARRCVR